MDHQCHLEERNCRKKEKEEKTKETKSELEKKSKRHDAAWEKEEEDHVCVGENGAGNDVKKGESSKQNLSVDKHEEGVCDAKEGREPFGKKPPPRKKRKLWGMQ